MTTILPTAMTAMVCPAPGQPLVQVTLPVPRPEPHQVLIQVAACGVCRTDLHVVDGDLTAARLPIVPGHEIVGYVVQTGERVTRLKVGDRVGVPWLGHTCKQCEFCRNNRENLCDHPGFTGYTLDGGYAQYTVADADYSFALNGSASDVATAPLLCAGLIGYRAYRMAGNTQQLGLYGFGAAAHILCQVAVQQGNNVYAFTRKGDTAAQALALSLGACWVGHSEAPPPHPLDSAILFAPVGELVPQALKAINKGGTVVCAGIHMSDIPRFPYADLWGERSIRSVANLTRADGDDFFALIDTLDWTTQVTPYPLAEAQTALNDLRAGQLTGAAVLVNDHLPAPAC